MKNIMKKTWNKKIIGVLILILLDIIVKIIVETFWMDYEMTTNFIGFLPYLNTEQLSLYNMISKGMVDIEVLFIVNILLIFIIILLRKKEKERLTLLMDISLLMILAGGICSVVDKLVRGGSLDYIFIMGYVFDLKDIYLYLGAFIYILELCRVYFRKKRIVGEDGNG